MTTLRKIHPTSRRAITYGAALCLPLLAWALLGHARAGLILPAPIASERFEPLPQDAAIIAATCVAFGLGTLIALWRARHGSPRAMFTPDFGRALLCLILALFSPIGTLALIPKMPLFALAYAESWKMGLLAWVLLTLFWIGAAGLIIARTRPAWLRVLLFGQAWFTLFFATMLAFGFIPLRM